MSSRDNPEAAKVRSDFQAQQHGNRDGEPSIYTCPECGGTVWEFREGNLMRLRCHVGHVYSESSFVDQQTRRLEATLWRTVRELAEHASLGRRLAQQQADPRTGEWYEARAMELDRSQEDVRRVLARLIPLNLPPPNSSD